MSHWEFDSQLENITGDTLAAVVNCALAVAGADGSITEDEIGEVAQTISEVLGGYNDAESISSILVESLDRLANEGSDALFSEAASVIDDPTMRAVAMLAAGATAWKSKGINTKEGLALQALGREMGFSQNEYFELLGQSKNIAS
jgi:hypothetical protein